MPTETERKYLVSADDPRWRAEVRETRTLRQGYLSPDPACEIRIRVIDDTAAYLTVKGPRDGPTRAEYEYPVPVADALELLGLCGPRVLVKHRHTLPDDWIVERVQHPRTRAWRVAEIEWQGDARTLVDDAHLGGEQVHRQGQGGGGDHDSDQDQAEQLLLAGEGVDVEDVSGGDADQGAERRAEARVEQGVGVPAEVDAVAGGGRVRRGSCRG
ncbi:hypothetical protein SCALM49S_04341 [Streptomyces californicus]